MSFTGTAFSALMIQARAEWTDAIAASLSAREAGGEELAAAFSRAWKALAVMVVMGIIMSGLVQPLMILFFKHYTLSWRLAVTVAYIKAWEQRLDSMPVPEGASQRIHEDVEQMSNSFMRFGSSLLRSIFSLMIFVPKLWYAGDVFPVPWLPQGYLLIMGVFSSGIGLAGAALISRALVGLFVAVQQSEGALRKRLAVMEDLTPLETGTLIGSSLQRIGSLSKLFGTTEDDIQHRFFGKLKEETSERRPSGEFDSNGAVEPEGAGGPDGSLDERETEWIKNQARHIKGRSMMPLLALLRRLFYRQFMVEFKLQFFSAVFEDITPNIVWLVTLPELFDPGASAEATPGQAIALSQEYEQAVNSLNFLLKNWPQIAKIRSVIKRLDGYEQAMQMDAKAFRKLVRAGPSATKGRNLVAQSLADGDITSEDVITAFRPAPGNLAV